MNYEDETRYINQRVRTVLRQETAREKDNGFTLRHVIEDNDNLQQDTVFIKNDVGICGDLAPFFYFKSIHRTANHPIKIVPRPTNQLKGTGSLINFFYGGDANGYLDHIRKHVAYGRHTFVHYSRIFLYLSATTDRDRFTHQYPPFKGGIHTIVHAITRPRTRSVLQCGYFTYVARIDGPYSDWEVIYQDTIL